MRCEVVVTICLVCTIKWIKSVCNRINLSKLCLPNGPTLHLINDCFYSLFHWSILDKTQAVPHKMSQEQSHFRIISDKVIVVIDMDHLI